MSTERTVDRKRKCAYYRAEQRHACHFRARQQAMADRSDPFTYARTMSHLLHGPAELDDYNVDWVPRVCKTPQGDEYTLMVPVNMRRP